MEHAGSLIGTAGANGNFTVELDLSEVAPLLDVGSSVSFDAVWIGPTRERLTASGSTSVQFSPFKVSLTLGVDAMGLTPGRTFGIVASVDGPSGPPQQSVEVRLYWPLIVLPGQWMPWLELTGAGGDAHAGVVCVGGRCANHKSSV